MTGFLLGDDGPELRVPAHLAASLWPVLREHFRELERRGATRRMEELKPLLTDWQLVAGRWALRQRPRFPGEVPQGNADPLGGLSSCDDEQDWITTTDAAAMTGRSRQWVGARLRSGDVEGYRGGREWMVSRRSLVAFSERRDGAA